MKSFITYNNEMNPTYEVKTDTVNMSFSNESDSGECNEINLTYTTSKI